jgi:hypothetical protein
MRKSENEIQLVGSSLFTGVSRYSEVCSSTVPSDAKNRDLREPMKKWPASLLLLLAVASPSHAATCEDVLALKATNVTITAAGTVAAGQFIPPDENSKLPVGVVRPATAPSVLRTLPAFCRVQGVVRPSGDSNIRFEVWLPTSAWNGRYLGVGIGGAGGRIPYDGNLDTPGLIQALREGFAASATDTGHQGSADDYSFGRGQPERRVDYHYRAIHETAVVAKAMIRAFYGSAPRFSYFWGRSVGGTQGLMEVQRYPADYDGVLAASPLVDRAATWTTWVWIAQAFAVDGSQIPESKLPTIQAAVIESCDTLDGLRDGIIANPTECRFDPEVLLCKGSDPTLCLTQPQVTALKKYYAGPRSASGEQIAPSFSPGAEACVELSMTCEGSAARRAGNWIDALLSSEWNVQTFDFDRDAQALAADPGVNESKATDPNLKMFMDRGGKLIVEHGWSDGTSVPMSTVDYFRRIVSTMGSQAVESFLRLYMIPGMAHTGVPGLPNAPTGPGLNRFRALQQWVETGKPPEAIVATKYRVNGDPTSGVVRTRPLCPYPQVAVYKGRGSADDATNFLCAIQ